MADILLFSIMGGAAAYVTNFMGFKDWIDLNVVKPAEATDDTDGTTDPSKATEAKGTFDDFKSKPGTTFNCVSYPRCNTAVKTTDARKKCCCSNKCALMGRTFKSLNLSTGVCLCNPKTTTTTTKPAPKPPCKCAFGKVNPVLTGRDCAAACCRLYGAAKCATKQAVLNSKNACVCTSTATVVHNSNCTSVGTQTCWKSSGCYNGKTGIYAICISGRARCTDAAKAFVKARGCPSYLATAYPANVHNNYAQVPTVA